MPGKKETKRKTKEEVEASLQHALYSNAQKLMQQVGRADNDKTQIKDGDDFEDLLYVIANKLFQTKYGFQFDTSPPGMSSSSANPRFKSAAQLCSMDGVDSDQAQKYIKAKIFSDVDLPAWMRDIGEDDLVTVAINLASHDTNKEWNYVYYHKTFDADLEDMDSWNVSSVLVYSSGQLTDDAIKANLCIIYYMGVYYPTVSPTKKVRDNLRTSAYTSARSLTSYTKEIKNLDMLEDAMLTYGKTLFKKRFNYDYMGKAPDYPTDEGSWLNASGQGVIAVPDLDKAHNLDGLIRTKFFSAVDIKATVLKDNAVQEVTDKCEVLIQDQASDSWTVVAIQDEYGIKDPTYNPIKTNGFLIYWNGHQVTDAKVTVSMTYFFYMGMFYEILPARLALPRHLFKDLCVQLTSNMSNPPPLGNMSQDVVRNIATLYAKERFQTIFGFNFDKDAPDKTKKTTHRDLQLLYLNDFPATEKEIDEWMKKELWPALALPKKLDNNSKTDSSKLAPGTTNPTQKPEAKKPFPDYVMDDLYDDVKQHLLRYTGQSVAHDGNFWYLNTEERVYADPNRQKPSIHQYAVYMYVLGKKREDAYDDAEYQVLFCGYFAYYCGTDPGPTGNDWD